MPGRARAGLLGALAVIALAPAGLAVLVDMAWPAPSTATAAALTLLLKLATFLAGMALLALLGERHCGLLAEARALATGLLARRTQR